MAALPLLATLARVPLAAQECNLSARNTRRMASLEAPSGLPDFAARKGILYLDAGCRREAALWLGRAAESLGPRTDAGPHDLERVSELRGLLAIARAQSMAAAGQAGEARQGLLETARTYVSREVAGRATLEAAQLWLSASADPVWVELGGALRKLAPDPDWGWRAKNLLVSHSLLLEGPAKALGMVEESLRAAGYLQDCLQYQILAISLLLQAGRVTEAQILAANLERDMGEELLDRAARVEFLRLSSAIWEIRSKEGAGPDAQKKFREYSDACHKAAAQL